MDAIASGIDRILAWLKWPVALTGLLAMPGLVAGLYRIARAIHRDPDPCLPFLVGMAAYLLAWFLLLRRRTLGTFLVTLEHELTHAIFAWLTFHRVVGFRASLRGGGHVRYVGRGNWLISVAPYFVPTFSLLAIAVLHWLPAEHLAAGSAALGATVSYHLTSTWAETHRNQPDLREVGFLWSALFLVPANALVLGLVLATAIGAPLGDYLQSIPDATRDFIKQVRS